LLYFVRCLTIYYRDKKVVGVFVRFRFPLQNSSAVVPSRTISLLYIRTLSSFAGVEEAFVLGSHETGSCLLFLVAVGIVLVRWVVNQQHL
jgi:hypothetical protein